jgi:DNA adenine methylase
VKKARPFLKWAGGKTQLLPELTKHVPPTYGRYIEPMVGGGALFFHLRPEVAILGDLNEELINCYRVVRDEVEAVIGRLRRCLNEEEFYYRVRAQDPHELDTVCRAARTIYLNKTCFNGLYRVNKSGKFNVPFGRRRNPTICDEEGLRCASAALQGVRLVAGDYKDILREHAVVGDFVYLDPPYHPVGGYADFKRFTKEFFYEEDHIELRDEFHRLVETGSWVLLTNSNTEFVRSLYEGFDYAVLDTRRSISSNPSTRTGEDLVVMATRPPRRSLARSTVQRSGLLRNFPGTRFMGSKYSLLPFIWECVRDLPFSSVLDAFSGSACVSYMFKQHGKTVVSNDFMHFTYYFAKALIENPRVVLQSDEVEALMQPNSEAGSFIRDTFRGLYFTDDENSFLDSLRANIESLDDRYKRALALAAISRACMKRRPRGVFTYVGDRYDDGRRDLRLSLQQHFLENVDAFNRAVFDNGRPNLAFNEDVFDLDPGDIDLVYLDPPYYTPNSDNDYTRRYHFVEGLVRQWAGLTIQQKTRTKKFERYETPFISKDAVHSAFQRLFQQFQDSIIVVSYSSNSFPEKGDIVNLLKTYKRRVRVYQARHQYSFGTHAHKPNSSANRTAEFVFVAQ